MTDIQQYPYGPADRTAGWDEHAWDGKPAAAPGRPAVPESKHRFLPFLAHRWFWLMVLGQVLVVIPAYLASGSNSTPVAALSVVGFVVFMAGFVLLFAPHLRFGELPGLRKIILWGVVSGAVGAALAHVLEQYVMPKVFSFRAELWFAGPVEETSKLVVPVLLLAFGAAMFKDPRTGFLLTLVSGATFGAWEGKFYTADLGENWGRFFMASCGRSRSSATPSGRAPRGR